MKFFKHKFVKILLWTLGIIILILIFFYSQFPPARNITWGVSFSQSYASFLGLDWRKVYVYMLDDLRPQRVRLMAYWDNIEPEQGKYRFEEIDFMLSEAEKRGTGVLLVVGRKQPRWPECHEPGWAKKMSGSDRDKAVLEMLGQAVNHFKQSKIIAYWQVENEPLFSYGPDCQPTTREQIKKEIDLVGKLDARPVVVTDSGEKGAWLPLARTGGDIFGSTMYREAYYEKKGKYVAYPLPPAYYRLHAGMVRTLTHIKNFMGVELQAEPWFVNDANQTPWEEQARHMNPEIFKKNIRYARSVGFSENYLWGVEWWYWAKTKGHGEMWETAKQLFSQANINNQ